MGRFTSMTFESRGHIRLLSYLKRIEEGERKNNESIWGEHLKSQNGEQCKSGSKSRIQGLSQGSGEQFSRAGVESLQRRRSSGVDLADASQTFGTSAKI